MKLASRASRTGLTAGFLRSLCNGLYAAQRFHVEGEEQMCRIGCPDGPDSLTLQRMSSVKQFLCLSMGTSYYVPASPLSMANTVEAVSEG